MIKRFHVVIASELLMSLKRHKCTDCVQALVSHVIKHNKEELLLLLITISHAFNDLTFPEVNTSRRKELTVS